MRVARTPHADDLGPWVLAMSEVLPRADVEVVDVPGPPVSPSLRAAGWAEGQVLRIALGCLERDPDSPAVIDAGDGARAEVTLSDDVVRVEVWAGEILDAVTLRSYVIGAAHHALGWVWQEGLAVDETGEPVDLTIRSLGILRGPPDATCRCAPPRREWLAGARRGRGVRRHRCCGVGGGGPPAALADASSEREG